jgi:hypothetical protein
LWKAAADAINTLLAFVLTVVVPFVFFMVRSWMATKKAEMQAKIDAIKNEDLRKGMSDALQRLDNTAATVVADLEATVKQYSDQGKVVDPDKLKAFAFGRIKARLDPVAAQVITDRLGGKNFDRLTASKIEQKALALKLLKAGCAAATPKVA